MPVEKTEWEIGTLIGAISHGEIKLPEIQRGRMSAGAASRPRLAGTSPALPSACYF